MSSVLYFVIFAFVCQKVLLEPLDHQKPTNVTLKSLHHLVEMGQGLEEIPIGRARTRTLNLAYNHISTLPEYVFHNSSYRSLNKIELYQNKISNIHVTAFRGMKQLTTVVLSDNNITSLDPYTFRHNSKLDKLDLSRNRIIFNRLRVFLVSQSLKTLTVAENRIEQIFELTFMGVPNLKTLNLDGNILYVIAEDSFKSLSKLQYLSLANTGVYRLSESMFSNNLPRVIDLRDTPLSKRFDPPLKKITNTAVRSLMNIDQFIFISDTPV